MIGPAMVLGLFLVGADGPRAAARETAADRITLRDGSVVMGLVTSATTGPRASVEFLVRRAWAEKNLKHHLRQLGSFDRGDDAAGARAATEAVGGLASGTGLERRAGRPHHPVDRPGTGEVGRSTGSRSGRPC